MRRWQRTALKVWFFLCVLIALYAITPLIVTYAPRFPFEQDPTRKELAGMEDMREILAPGTIASTAAMLISSAIAMRLATRSDPSKT